MVRFSSSAHAWLAAWVSKYCSWNSIKSWSQRAGMLSVAGFSLFKASPMLWAHLATFSPCIKVRVKAIFFIGKVKPGTSLLRHM